MSTFTYVFVFPAKAEIHSTQPTKYEYQIVRPSLLVRRVGRTIKHQQPQRITQTALVKQTSRAYNPVNQKAFGDDFGFDIVDEA